MPDTHHANIVIVKSAIIEQRVDLRIITKGGTEIRALVPDIFTRDRGVRQNSQFQDFPRLFSVDDNRNVAWFRRSRISRKGTGHEASKIFPSGRTKAEPTALPFSPQKFAPGGITGSELARTQFVSVFDNRTTVCGLGESVQFSVNAMNR